MVAIFEQASLQTNAMCHTMWKGAHKERKSDLTNFIVCALDPGETTGMAFTLPWETENNQFRVHLKQIPTKTVETGYDAIKEHMPQTRMPIHWIVEDYKVYGWKTDDHAWAGLHTAQLIGAIKILVHQRQDDIHFRMAQQAKSFATDDMLKRWGIYNPGMKHARDAQRHLMTTIFFGH